MTALSELAAEALLAGVEYRYEKLPWWKAILKRRRYERVIASTPMSRLLESRSAGLPAGGYDTVHIPKIESLGK